MRSIQIDQFEFDEPSSEESLEINVARQSKFPCPNVSEFVAITVGVKAATTLPDPIPFHCLPGKNSVIEHLNKFAGIEIFAHSTHPTYNLVEEAWEIMHIIICMQGFFIRYQWTTSA